MQFMPDCKKCWTVYTKVHGALRSKKVKKRAIMSKSCCGESPVGSLVGVATPVSPENGGWSRLRRPGYPLLCLVSMR